MTQQPEDQAQGRNRERTAGVRLARLLRRWWEESGGPSRGTRPTQQALAARVGVDQTTLSRYLNPGHLSTAPLRVVEALHAQLRAPAGELDEARALCAAALRENSRQRTAAPGGPAGRTASPDTAPLSLALLGAAPVETLPARKEAAARTGSRWLPPVLVAALVVMAFTAGVVVHAWWFAAGREEEAEGSAAGAVATRVVRHKWPVLIMRDEDQFTRARALQYLLRSHGYQVRTDGFFREDTRDAVTDFQRKRLLPADGKVGDQTWPELVRARVVGPDSGPFEVRAVQELLDNVGQGGTPVSGTFTSMTADALKYFQRTRHLPDTGRADTNTWLALLVGQLPPVSSHDD
ncbi:peptidoglycan-binding protein [Streptomyces sp. NPDC048718]|uniref:peptidoglycan-binding protein n=1 Tax=Streptomyces sp. NPDC048718 TaxID=3365587 RepID=UPI0037103B35